MAPKTPAYSKPPPLPYPTRHFQRFGSTNEKFLPEGKSGLTPLKTAVYPLTREEWAFRRRLREYQKFHLESFTTKEFILSASLHDPSIGPSDLKGIHQIFAPKNWDCDLPAHLAAYPLGHGRVGEFWRADHPDVWKVLRPVLALTTKFLENCHIWPWWDAIINGERSGLAVLPDRDMFFARPPEEANSAQARRSIRNMINGLVNPPRPLRFSISSGMCDPEQGLCAPAAWKAIYMPTFLHGKSPKVHVSYHRLSALLFGELTEEERLIVQFEMAIGLFHELAHAVGSESAPLDEEEPFYEDEDVAELGYSMINAVFGGRDFSIAQETRDNYFHLRGKPPLGLTFQEGFPTRHDLRGGGDILDPALRAGVGTFTEYIIPVRYVSDVQKEEFWRERFPRFGLEALRPQPLGLGFEESIDENQKVTTAYRIVKALRDNGLSADAVLRSMESQGALLKNGGSILEEEETFSLEDYYAVYGRGTRFRSVKDVDGTFDASMPRITRFVEIRNFLNAFQRELALPSMVEWTPSNLLFNYIHRQFPGQISPEDFLEFLIYCQSAETLFEFRRHGEGEVRTIPTGWGPVPPKAVVLKPPGQREFRKKLKKHKNSVFATNLDLWDLDIELFFDRFNNFIRRAGGDPVSREEFDQGMKYLDYRHKDFTLGPPGIIRRIRKPLKVVDFADEELDVSGDESFPGIAG